MKIQIIALFLFLGVGAKADPIAKIMGANSSASPYQVLQRLYEDGTAPAKFSDFDVFKQPSKQKCAGAALNDSKAMSWYPQKQYSFIKKGRPSEGPLFPGTPNAKETILLNSAYETESADDISALAQAIQNTSTATELSFTMMNDPTTGSEYTPYVISFRENGPYVALKEIIRAGKKNQEVSYGYCWR